MQREPVHVPGAILIKRVSTVGLSENVTTEFVSRFATNTWTKETTELKYFCWNTRL